MDDVNAMAQEQLGRIKELSSQVGLKYVELPDFAMGAGIAVGFGEAGYVVLSLMGGGNEDKLMITSGLLKDIRWDRLTTLNVCNQLTSNNPMLPVFLHEAETGGSLLVQSMYMIDLMLDNPDYFAAVVVSTAQTTTRYRAELVENLPQGGQPWQWTADDLSLLLRKSLT